MKKLKKYWSLANEKRYQTLAGTLSFFLIFSIVPLMFLSLYLIKFLSKYLSINTSFFDKLNFISFDLHPSVSIIFILTTILGAAQLFFHVRRTGEIIYNIKKPKNSFFTKLVSCIGVILFLVILDAGIILILFAQNLLGDHIPYIFVKILSSVLLFIIIFLLVVVLNKYASPNKLSFNEVKKGSIWSIIICLFAGILFYLYVIYFANYNFLYGYLTTIIIGLMFIYIIMQGLVFGFIINYANNKK